MFPLNYKHVLPEKGPGSFGALRSHDIHTGVDLYADVGDEVFAMEDGIVTNIELYTGKHAGSDWWNDTYSVFIEGNNCICYGEIEPCVHKNQKIKAGDVIGTVLQVLKKDKGKNPPAMLHIEQYKKGTIDSVIWNIGEEKPECLLDVTPLLKSEVNNPSLEAVRKFYGDTAAKRSGVLYINHIIEGLAILNYRKATELEKQAWCLHPMVQNDKDFVESVTIGRLNNLPQQAVAVAMEYRRVANGYLSPHSNKTAEEIELSPLEEVNNILIADKVQNRKDFEKFLCGREDVPNSERLKEYFDQWLKALGISEEEYQRLALIADTA